MTEGTIVLVHGTGVRLKGYKRSFDTARWVAATQGIGAEFVECAWGDALGIDYTGLSLPDPPSEKQLREEAQEFAEWRWLFDDPLFELQKLTIRDTSQYPKSSPPPGVAPAWKKLFDRIAAYQPSPDMTLLLKRGELEEFFAPALSETVQSDVTQLAFEKSAHELPVACKALARGVIANIHIRAIASDRAGPSKRLRQSLVLRLLDDWGQVVFAPTTFFTDMLKHAVTRWLRRSRNEFSESSALPLGDVLLYQARGAEVREYIRKKVDKATPPVTLVAHSLGGIACFDLLAMDNPPPPSVSRLVTIGSQSPFLYEIGALASLKPPALLPSGFPAWLNIYDRNDFLSYVAKRLFPGVTDMEVESGQPFPDSHSAYFANEAVWQAIHEFPAKP